MSGQVPWQNGRRAWERLGGWHHPERLQPVTDENRAQLRVIARHALEDIRLVRGLLDQAELGAVRRARSCGADWTEIATLLGVSRQAAWERWHEDGEQLPVADQHRTLHDSGSGDR